MGYYTGANPGFAIATKGIITDAELLESLK
jgi:hypothetical protein